MTRQPAATYDVDTDPERVDLDTVWEFLSTEAYWGRWRSRADVEAQVRSAWRVAGVYERNGAMAGFARAVSDGVAMPTSPTCSCCPTTGPAGSGVGWSR